MPPVTAVLCPHPARPGPALRRFGVAVAPQADPPALDFRFRIEGRIGTLRLPATGSPRRLDGLWHHSCFEAFVRPDASDGYCEFNFAPGGDWAAYRFSARRDGRTLPELPAPFIEATRAPELFELSARVPLATLPELAMARSLHVGLAAVLETTDGACSYWALAHAAAAPDFHDPSTFQLRIGPA